MSRRTGKRSAASASRQLGANDPRNRRKNQIDTQDELGSSVMRTRGRLEVRAGDGLTTTAAGVKVVAVTAVTDAVDTTDIVIRFNELLTSLRTGKLLET